MTGHRAVVLDERDPADAAALADLRAQPHLRVVDAGESQRAELGRLLPAVDQALLDEPGRWVHYPWRGALVRVLGPAAFRLLRLDRNRNKITHAEQERCAQLRVGVVGLSVGHVVAHTLAMAGLCGELRLADMDTIELSNLNRIPAGVLDLGENKAVVAARRIAEIDPYLTVTVQEEGITTETLPSFLDGLDVCVEECDSLDVKVAVREAARARRIPVIMETSDRGLLDVERFDLEPDRPLFHGLLGDVSAASLAGASMREKIPHVVRLVDPSLASSRMGASLVEVGVTLSSWPQLGGDVVLGAASVAAAVRRIGLGLPLASGRGRVDLDEHLDDLAAPPLDAPDPVADAAAEPVGDVVDAVVAAIQAAPSGGNIQPWRVSVEQAPTGDVVALHLVAERTTRMDVAHRGSHVSLGAALHNARIAAAAAGRSGAVAVFPAGVPGEPVATLTLSEGTDPELAEQRDAMLARGTNRRRGERAEVPAAVAQRLHRAAEREGGALHLLTETADVVAAARILGAADRVRFLTPALHREMVGELRTPGRDALEAGLDLRTLELDPADLATLDVIGRGDVMAHLADWELGAALGMDTVARVSAASAIAVVTVTGADPADYVRGGAAVESVWLAAERDGLAVAPTSPVFLYARDTADLRGLAPERVEELAGLRRAFTDLTGLADDEAVALVLRLSHAGPATTRSRRLPRGALRG